MWYGISLCSVCVSCPGYVLSQDFAHPEPAGVGANVGKAAWMLWGHCSAVAKTCVFSVASQLLLQSTGSEGCWGENELCLSQTQCLKTMEDFAYKWIVFSVISGISQFHLGWSLQEWVLGSFGMRICVVIFLVVINDPFFLQEIWFLLRSTIRSFRKGSCFSLL